MTTLSINERASAVIEMLVDDRAVPDVLRRLARSLRAEVADRPHIVLDRLERASAKARYPLTPPNVDLAKVMTLERYWSYYASDDIRAFFPDAVGYQRYVERQADPGGRLLHDLKTDFPLIPARNSWVTSNDAIASRSGSELVHDLELEAGTTPPLAVLVIPAERARALGIRIRAPRATDAITSRQLQWRLTGLASGVLEWVDRDIPRGAVESVAWRP